MLGAECYCGEDVLFDIEGTQIAPIYRDCECGRTFALRVSVVEGVSEDE